MLKNFKDILEEFSDAPEEASPELNEEKKAKPTKDLQPEDILRDNGYKIKDIFITHFGKEIILAKKYSESELKKVLKTFKAKIKNNNYIFIES